MFEGINNFRWDTIPAFDRDPKRSPSRIPQLLHQLLDNEKSVRLAALFGLSHILVEHDQIAYFTAAALPTMPFLLEVFNTEDYKEKTEILEILSSGMMLRENFGPDLHSVSEELRQIYQPIIDTLRPHLPEFYPLLEYKDVEVQRNVVGFLCCFSEDADLLIPVLLDFLERGDVQDIEKNRTIAHEWSILQLFKHSSPTHKQIRHYLGLCHHAFLLRQEHIRDESDSPYSRQLLIGYSKRIAKTFPEDIHDDIINFLLSEFYKSDWGDISALSITFENNEHFKMFLILLDIVSAGRRPIEVLSSKIIDILRSASIDRQRAIVDALVSKLSADEFTKLAGFFQAELPNETYRGISKMLSQGDTTTQQYSEDALKSNYHDSLKEEVWANVKKRSDE